MATSRLSPISGLCGNNRVGMYVTKGTQVSLPGASITSDYKLPYVWNIIRVGSDGDLVLEDLDGGVFVYSGLFAGAEKHVGAGKILTTATVGGHVYTTTVQHIWVLHPADVI